MQSETHSATPTIVEDDSGSVNREEGGDLYPGPDEKKKHPYLVEFDDNDPLNPKVRSFHTLLSLYTGLTTTYRHGLGRTGGILPCSLGYWY